MHYQNKELGFVIKHQVPHKTRRRPTTARANALKKKMLTSHKMTKGYFYFLGV